MCFNFYDNYDEYLQAWKDYEKWQAEMEAKTGMEWHSTATPVYTGDEQQIGQNK